MAKNINEIFNILDTKTGDPENDYKNYYNNVIIPQLFKRQLNGIKNKEAALEIVVGTKTTKDLNIVIKNNLVEKFQGSINETFSDAVYIESPTAIQSISFILHSLAFGGTLLNASQQRIAGLPYHLYDLVYKIANNADNIAINEFSINVDEIRAAIGGKLFYDQATRSVVLERENQENIFDFNIASGIKALGILDILLSENILNNKTLLIIDEPEVHLHPKWEVEYARILVQLSKAGIPIIITSHSPDLLEAITAYVKIYDTKNITKFYFGSKIEGSSQSIFNEVSDDLEPIFKALAEPIHNLFFNPKK